MEYEYTTIDVAFTYAPYAAEGVALWAGWQIDGAWAYSDKGFLIYLKREKPAAALDEKHALLNPENSL